MMSAPMARLGIRFQMTALFVAVIVATAAGIALAGNLILGRTLGRQVAERTAQVEGILRARLAARGRDLEHAVDLAVHNETLRNQFHYESWADAQRSLDELVKSVGADAAAALDADGKLQASSGAGDKLATSLTRKQLGDGAGPVSLLEPIDGRLAHVAAERVSFFGNARGVLLIGKQLNDAIARELRDEIGAEVIAFSAGGRAASLPLDQAAQSRLAPALAGLESAPWLDLGSLSAGGERYRMRAVGLKHDGRLLAGLAFGLPEKDIVVAQRRTLVGAVGLAVLITILGAALGLTVAGRIARPIVGMAEQFQRINASGDLSLRVPDRLRNEIGDMARSFNAMQERVQELHGKVAQAEERMRKELQMASALQEMLLRQVITHDAVCDLAVYTATLVETSGDWYASFEDPEAQRTVVVIADASGHGAAAALLTAITHGFFQTLWTWREGGPSSALAQLKPKTILELLNQVVLKSAQQALSATAFLATLDHRTREMSWACAGHTPPILARFGGATPGASFLPCPPSSSIGSSEDATFAEGTVALQRGDLLLVYTDGLTETENRDGAAFGPRRLIGLLRGCERASVEQVRQEVIDAVTRFAGGEPPKDDVTYLALKIR
jgi:serine phosphatase RsbU (regulator of sigma subunit)